MFASTIRHKLTLATMFVLLLTFALPITTQAHSNLPAKLSPSNGSPHASARATSRPPVKLPQAKGHHHTPFSPTNVTISSTTGWQQTGLTVQQGSQYTVSYVSGTWTVDVNNFPFVGPDGYPPDIDKQIYQGCKYDPSLVYATLLGQVGSGSEFGVGLGGTFTADASGILSLRINDQDGCLGDNAGSVTMTVDTNATQSLTVNQVWTTDSNSISKTNFAPGDAIYYWAQVNNPNSTTVTATFTFLATGPQTILSWSGPVSVPPGTTNFYYPTTVPGNAPSGTYTFTATVLYNGVSSSGQSQFTVTANRGKLFLFIQGINSTLSATDAMNNTIPTNKFSFGQSGGIYQLLLKTYPNAQFRMFSYNGADGSGTPQAYQCQDTFTQYLSTYVSRLNTQITNYLNNNPNTDVYLIGHSMGGTVILGLLAYYNLNGFPLVNGGSIAGVVSLDSPVGGTEDELFGLGFYFTKQHFEGACPALKKQKLPVNSLSDLFSIFDTGGSPPDGGIDSVMNVLYGVNFSNQEVASYAASNNAPVLTIGNVLDYTYDPGACQIFTPDFLSTQWVLDQGNNSGIYGRVFQDSNGLQKCTNISKQIAANHFDVLTNASVQTGLQQFFAGQTPSALAVAPPGHNF